MLAISSPIPTYVGLDGKPLDNGYLYFGQVGKDPITHPITVYWDLAGTMPAAQPIRTINGCPARAGTPANVYVNADHSLTVKDSKENVVIYQALAAQFGNTGQIGYVVGEEQTIQLDVPAGYPTIQAALAAIVSWIILGKVRIKVADGTHMLSSRISLNHEYGHNVQLIGNVANPDSCILRVASPATFDAVVCENGHTFGLLDGFLIDTPIKATLANNVTGVLANNGATIYCGKSMKVNNFYYGIAARNGSYVMCDYAQVTNAGDVGIWSFVGSTVSAQYATSSGAADAVNEYGFGFQAEYGSSLDCSYANATGCKIAGIAALSGSQVRALNATASTNTGSGFLARDDGSIENHNAIASDNAKYGEEFISSGVVRGGNKTLTGNTLGATSGYAYFDNRADLGARIAANGNLRIDNNGSGQTYFNTSGGLQYEVRHIASATSRFYAQGGNAGTGDQAILGTDGNAADVSGRFQVKGAGQLYFNNGNGTQASIGNTAAAKNHPELRGGATGKPAVLAAAGEDPIVDLALFPKGVGSHVQIGAGFVPGAVTPNGAIPIKLNDGSIFYLSGYKP